MNQPPSTSRRDFLKQSGTVVAGAAQAGTLATPRAGYCAEDNTIKVDQPAPVTPDSSGRYPVAIPGRSRVV